MALLIMVTKRMVGSSHLYLHEHIIKRFSLTKDLTNPFQRDRLYGVVKHPNNVAMFMDIDKDES